MMGLRKSAVLAVCDLLDVQHKALLGGDLEQLDGMETALSRAFARLRRDGAGLSDLERVKQAAARNATLVQAAQSGVAQARAHLSTARAAPLTTYDASGRSQPGTQPQSRTLARG